MKRLLLIALMVLVTLVGMISFSRAGNEVSVLQATANTNNEAVSALQTTVNTRVPASAKKYYLTVDSFSGSAAITACYSGFHMASISEIQDPGTLRYATRSIDQGLGPPADHMGWVRSGYFTTDWVSGNLDLCNSSSGQQSGTMMSSRSRWDVRPSRQYTVVESQWWYATQGVCSQPHSVWCVEDPE